MSSSSKHCQYRDPENFTCSEEPNASGYCYWHDKSIDKTGPEVKEALIEYTRSGGLTRGISLKHADLSNIDLVNHHNKQGFDFSYADLYRANLKQAHLFNITFDHASLMKADLSEANLNCANVKNSNLLGIKWQGCKIENLKLGKKLWQQSLARKSYKRAQLEQSLDYLEQAEEVYRDLRKHAEHEGLFSLAGELIQRELTMRRLQMPRLSFKRFGSKIVDIFCGYGEAPLRIVGISMCVILICAILYTFTGLNYQGEIIRFESTNGAINNFYLFLSCLYYSVVTFTTLGYGDFTPVGISRAIAAFEAFSGSFTIALFVVVFVKKMTR